MAAVLAFGWRGRSTAREHLSGTGNSDPDRGRRFAEDEWINPGGAVVVKPFDGIVAGPLHRTKEILYADIDVEAAGRSLDVSGHYGRPDIFRLEVDRAARSPAYFADGTPPL
jgi:nitrilase